MIHVLKSDFSLIVILLVLIIARPLPLSAQIQYTDINPDAEIHSSADDFSCYYCQQYDLDINFDGTIDFILHAKCVEHGGYTDSLIISIESASSLDSFVADEYVDTLNFNDVIHPSLNWVNGEKALLKRNWYPHTYSGTWTVNIEHFAGLKVKIGSSDHFGWVRMAVTGGCGQLIIKDFAFQSQAEEPILAGQGLENFALNVQTADVGDQKNGADLKVNFDPAYHEAGILEYRVMVVDTVQAGTFTVDSANAVTADHYTSVPADGTSYSLQLGSSALSTNGQLITNGINYLVFILSCYENSSENVLSFPAPILLQTQTATVTNVFSTDNGNAGNGCDIRVFFNKVPNEDSISEYRIMVVPTEQTEMFDLEMADQIGQDHYTALVPADSNIVILLDSLSTDIYGENIIEETGYYIYVLSVADGILTDKNALSVPSNLIILSTPSYLFAGQMDESYIHYVDIEPDTVVWADMWETGNPYYKLDLNGDGTNDYNFHCYFAGSLGYYSQGSEINGMNENNKIITLGNSLYIKKFNYGDPLTFMDGEKSQTSMLGRHVESDMEGSSVYGYWDYDQNKYAGFIMFQGNDTIMGWVKMSVWWYSSVTIKDYAWVVYSHQTIAAFTYQKNDYEVHFTNLSSGADSLYWDFGDGTYSNEKNPAHVYALEQDYQVSLIATGYTGSDIASEVIRICEMPTAAFTYELSQWGQLITSNHSIKAITCLWQFGDGDFSTETSPEHYYLEDGAYNLSLTVYRGECYDTASSVVNVCIFPKADFYYETDSNVFYFFNTSVKASSLYWDFGDGFRSILPEPVHAFSNIGEYDVTLHAFNACGEDSLTEMVYVAVEELEKNSGVAIYPIPASDHLVIEPAFPARKRSAYLYDPSGYLRLQCEEIKSSFEPTILDLTDIEEGSYLLKLFLDDHLFIRKVIVIK